MTTCDVIASSTRSINERLLYFQALRRDEPDYRNTFDQLMCWVTEINSYLRLIDNDHVRHKLADQVLGFEQELRKGNSAGVQQALARIGDICGHAPWLEEEYPNPA